MLEVVDRHRGDDRVEATERGQRLGQVVLDELDALIASEPLTRRVEHNLGEVEADSAQVRAIALEQRQQPAVAGAKVEHTANLRRDVVEQHAFAFPAARDSSARSRYRPTCSADVHSSLATALSGSGFHDSR